MKKRIAVLLAGAMMLGLAGCGGQTGNSSNASGNTSGNTSGNASGNSAEKAKLEGNLVYWSMWQETEPQADILKKAIEEFKTANSGVKLEVEWQGRNVRDLVSAAVAGGEKVDIFDSDPAAFYQTDPDIMMDLTDFFSSKTLDGSKTIGESILGGLIDWDKNLAKDYADGKNHSVPYNPFCIDFYYNTEHFSKAGIKKAPETWEELDQACAALKKAGFEPIVTDDAYMPMMFYYYVERMIGEPAIKEMSKNSNFKNDAILSALKAMEDFAAKGYFAESIKTNKYPAGQQQFARREASLYFNASFMASENAETAGENFPYGHFAYPVVPGGKGLITENSVGGQAFVVNAKTDNKEAAYELLRYFVGDNCQKDFLAHNLTPNLVNLEWPSSLDAQKPIVAAVTRNINWGAGFSGELVNSVVNENIRAVMLGEKKADDAYAAITAASK